MEKIRVTVESVFVFDEKEIADVQLHFAETIKGFAKNGVEFVEQDVNTLSMSRSRLTRQLCQANDLIDEYRACRAKAFDQKAFALILRGAQLDIVRILHAQGEIVLDKDNKPVLDKDGNETVYSRVCYTTDVVAVKLTDRAVAKLDAACSLD